MFREMRRKDRMMEGPQIKKVLENGEYGILASCGEDGSPYAIPYSYAMLDGKLYFHCTAKESHSKDNIRSNPNVCFTVVGETELLPAQFATCFESVVVFGTAKEILDPEQREAALVALLEKYSPAYMKEGREYIKAAGRGTSVIEITPLHMTGKARRRNANSDTGSGAAEPNGDVK